MLQFNHNPMFTRASLIRFFQDQEYFAKMTHFFIFLVDNQFYNSAYMLPWWAGAWNGIHAIRPKIHLKKCHIELKAVVKLTIY